MNFSFPKWITLSKHWVPSGHWIFQLIFILIFLKLLKQWISLVELEKLKVIDMTRRKVFEPWRFFVFIFLSFFSFFNFLFGKYQKCLLQLMKEKWSSTAYHINTDLGFPRENFSFVSRWFFLLYLSCLNDK